MALKPCPRCGKLISDKAERCPQCGLDIKNINYVQNPQNQQNISRPTIIDRPLPQGQPTIIEEPSQNELPTIIEQPKKSKKALWIFLCIILAVGIGAAIWIPAHHHDEKLKAEQLALIEQNQLDSIAAVEAERARLEQLRLDSIRQDSIAKMERLNKGKLQLFDIIKKDGYGYGQKSYSAINSTLISKGYTLESHKRKEVMAWAGPDPEPTGQYYDVWSFIFLRDPDDKNSVLYKIDGDECVISVTIFDDQLMKDFKKEVGKIKNNLENVYYESNKVGLVFCFGD